MVMPGHHIAFYLVVRQVRCATEHTMTAGNAPTDDRQEASLYEIRLKGYLDARWSEWFDRLNFLHASERTTIISGPVTDQAALHGLLAKVRDLGLALVSVIHVQAAPANVADVNADTDLDRCGHAPPIL
jgi:hypothetical protein